MLATDLLWFLPFTIPIAIWVAWSDMKFMRIPNMAVFALLLVYLVVGPFVFPLKVYAWGWALAGIVLLIGFIIALTPMVGAGDAKFAAAMAPFFASADIRMLYLLTAAAFAGGITSHRLMRSFPAYRGAASDWKSWTHPQFPMGLTLAGILVFYPLLASWLG